MCIRDSLRVADLLAVRRRKADHTSGNALAGMGAPIDGLLTVETQKQVPDTFTNVNTIELALSHNELLFSMEVVEIIKDMFFEETN